MARRPRLRRFLFRRQFLLRLPAILADGLRHRAERDRRVFVSLMGGVGDLVNAFPSLRRLAEHHLVDVGTGPGPYRQLVEANPHVRRCFAPFVYKPIRRAHRRLLERVLAAVYGRVILLDEPDSAWRTRRRHMSAVYAERCGCPPPDRPEVHLTDAARRTAGDYLRREGLTDYVYVVQLIRRERAFRSWPLAHHHALYERLRERLGLPVVVHTVGSDETAAPAWCHRVERADILTVAALIERARLFVGPDTGPTHIAAALGVPTVAIHLGYPPEVCGARGETVNLVRQRQPFDDPAHTSPAEVLAAVEEQMIPT